MKLNRKSILNLLVLGLLLPGMWGLLQVANAEIPEQVVEKARNATVLIVRGNADASSIGNGSGFFVAPDKIVTNIHVVDDAAMVFAVSPEAVYNIESVIGYDLKYDLVILKVSGESEYFSLDEGQIGEQVFAVGYPGGGYKVTEGMVHGIRSSNGELRLTSSNEDPILAPGNSGGAVLNSNGQVIGIATSTNDKGNFTTLGYASSSKAIKALLVQSGPVEPLPKWQKKPAVFASACLGWADEKRKDKEYDKAIKGYGKAIKLYPDFAGAYYNRGAASLESGNYEAAIKDYDKVIKLYPDSAKAYYSRGFASRESGNYEAAIKDYDKVIKLYPDWVDPYYGRGVAQEKRRDCEAAIKDYDKVIKLYPDSAKAYYSRGFASLESGNYEAAIKDFNKVINLNKEPAVHAYNKELVTHAYFQRGTAKAQRGAKGDYDGAVKDFDKVIKLRLDYADAYYNRGIAKKSLANRRKGSFHQYGRFAKNPSLLIKRRSKKRNLSEAAKRDGASAYYYWGMEDYARDDYQAAIEDYNKAITLVPNYAEAYYNRGNAYRLRGKGGDYQKAIEDYNKAITFVPDYAEAPIIYNNRGLAKVRLNDYTGAINDYTKAIKLKLYYAEAYYNRGNAYRLRGKEEDYQAAINDYTEAITFKAITFKTDYAEAYHGRGLAKEALGPNETAKLDTASAYYYWGKTDYNDKQYEKAIEKFDKAIALNPGYTEAYHSRGDSKRELGHAKFHLRELKGARNLYQAAIEDYTKALELNSENATVYYDRGATKFLRGGRGDYESAIEDMEKTIKLDSDYAYAYLLRGYSMCLLGYSKENEGKNEEARNRYSAAIKDFKEAIKLDLR